MYTCCMNVMKSATVETEHAMQMMYVQMHIKDDHFCALVSCVWLQLLYFLSFLNSGWKKWDCTLKLEVCLDHVRFECLTLVTANKFISWNMMPCSVVEFCLLFKGICFHSCSEQNSKLLAKNNYVWCYGMKGHRSASEPMGNSGAKMRQDQR
jgi:hypothetical protein